MSSPTLFRSLAIGSVCVGLAVAGPARADVITDWNVAAIAAMKAANIGGNPWTRNLAMMHVAMSDAVNSVQNKYALYETAGAMRNPDASAEAAAAAAARFILVQQVPAQKAIIEQAFEATIKGVPDSAARTAGIALGEKCAAAVLADRASDRTDVPDTYRPVTTPGVWIPTTPPIFAEYAQAKPWVIEKADAMRPGPPPDLKSELYARDYNETKDFGGARSTKRTPEQTAAVKFWTQSNLGTGWQEATRQISEAKKLSLADNARLFALLNMAIANTFILDWDAKFNYGSWRPVTAIRNGDRDGNDATERDPGWTSFNATPMHPEYPSQAAIIAGAVIGIFEGVLGPGLDVPVTATDLIDPKLQRSFPNIRLMAAEVQDVRIWGGVHFRNSLKVGYDLGMKISGFMVQNALKPTG
jgi:hypothetical protein